ncbi:MAG: type II secretion system F family protein [Burkholderiales bacterium]|nr:type II secretion system F family protein [Burkholderiales bacterium]
MRQFQLRVQGAQVQGARAASQEVTIEAASEAEAIQMAAKNGWQVLSIASTEEIINEVASKQKGQFPLLQFSQELLTLLEAGLNLNEAITTLHNKETRAGAAATLGEILLALQHGKSFSDTLAELPAIFPDIYVASMRAAERRGNLPEALGRFVNYQLQFDQIKKKLVSAAIYPAMLLGVGALVTLFLLGYVVPKFSVVYESSGRDIPWMSQMLLGFGKAIAGHSTLFLIGLGSLVGSIAYAFSVPAVRAQLLEWLLTLPFVAPRAAEFRLSRFYRALSLLLHAGIPLTKGLAMVAPMLMEAQQQQLALARRAVEEGQSFSHALEQYGLTTPVAQSLLKVGENTGRLSDMLERSAKFHDEEFARWVDWASKMLEPLLMTVIGVVIGAVVVLMYMPIFELAGSLS